MYGALVVEAYRLDRYDNLLSFFRRRFYRVVEAYRLDRYDNFCTKPDSDKVAEVVEAYRLDRYDNFFIYAF